MGIFDLSSWDNKDKALALGAVGSLASAWGNYTTQKTQNKLLKTQFEYEKSKDVYAKEKYEADQAHIADAFNGVKKKKKSDETTRLMSLPQ